MHAAALAWEQFRFERKMFWRNPSAAFFNFLLPLLLLVLTASAFGVDDEGLDILIPGVAGMGVLATTFTALAFNLTVPARRRRAQAHPRHADPGRRLPGRADRLGHAQRLPAGGDGGGDRATSPTASTGRRTRRCSWPSPRWA